MKIFWNATLFWWLLIMGCNIHEASSAYDLLLSCGNSVTSGSDCTMTCDTKMPSASAIQWYNGSTMTAVETVNCSNAGDLPYVSSCNTPGKFNLKITNAQFGRDSYAWSCSGPFGGDTSNATDGDTFVTVPLTRVTLTKPDATSISCVAVSNPAANVTLYEGSTPSQDKVIKTETSFTRTMDGFETQLTSAIEESKTYFCLGDNGVHVVNATNVPAPPTTPSPPVPGDTDCLIILIIIIIIIVILVLALIIFHIVIFYVKVSFKVMGILFFVNVILAVAAIIIGIVGIVAFALCEVIAAIIAIVIGVLTHLYKFFLSKHVLKKADVPHRHLCVCFYAYPWKTDDGDAPNGDATNTEMKNQNDRKKDDTRHDKKDDKKDDKKHDKKDDKEKKDEKNVESEDPTGRPLPPRTTQKTSDFASPKPKMKPKEGNGEELKPLRDAPRGGLPSPRVNHNDNDSASSASNVTPHVA